jgi:type IV pilus biogenesis protein CpaD/CtpE
MKGMLLGVLLALLAGCASRDIKVSCEGKLVPINHPVPGATPKEGP